MERHMRLSRAAVVLVTIALIAAIAAAVWLLGTAAPAEDGTVAEGYQPSATGTGISSMDPTRSDTDGDFYLTQDITITSLHSDGKWGQEFSGTFDGNGHTITINASHTTTCNDAGGMFIGLANGAVIKNLTIVVNSFHYGTSASDTANGGIIGGYASGNITVDNVKVILNQDSNTMHHGTDTYNGVDTYMYSTTGGHSSIAFNFGGLFGKVEGGTTTIKNTTVYNSAGGKYGFSAWTWVSKPTIGNGESWINIGGFVGSVQANKEGVNGNLELQNVKYDADDDAKISALAESGTDRNNYARLSPFLGVLNAGKFTVDNLIFNAGGTFTSMFYRDDTTKNEHNEGMYNGRGILIGYDVNKWLQTTDGVSSRKEVYLRNAITGDSGTGLGNGDAHTSLLAGNNSWMDGFMSYPSEIEDASFTDDGKIAFALPNRSGNIAKAVRQINQKDNVTTVSDAQIAEQVTEGGGLTWIEAPIVAHGDDTSVSASLNTVSTGAYNVQNYDTVSSADDTAYRGSKVYDGTMVKTPTLDVGGTTVNAWTADSTTADVGTKTFSYNANALSDYAAATYDGGTYLVKDGTIYSPGNINVGGASQTFTLGNAFSYTITPKAMNSVAVSVSETNLYEGEALLDEWLTVTSTDPSGIGGTAKWDEGQTLSTQTTTYKWTWTPNSDNYQSYSGTVELNVFEKQIVSIEVTKAPKTDYVAYDAFDPTGIEVTATYSDDTTAVLTDECAFKIVGADGNEVEGGIDKLFVSYDEVTVYLSSGSEVTTTIPINVDYVRFVVEQKAYNKDITYGDSYQWNAADFYTWHDNTEVVETYMDFYEVGPDLTDDISGIATADAGTEFIGRVLCRAFYKGEEVPEEEYDNFIGITNPDELATEVTLTIVPREVEIESKGIVSGTYSGEPVDLRMLFTAQGVNDDVVGLSFDITLNNETCDEVLGAGTYSVTASIASTEKNYTAKPVTITYTVTKLAIPKPQDAEEPIVYDGKEHDVTPTVPEYEVVDGTTKATNVGDYSVTIALTDKTNIEWEDGSSDDITVTWSITPATVTITGEYSGKTYDGQAVDPSSLFTAPNGVNDEGALQLQFAITVDDENSNEILNAGAYTVTASLAESVTNYTAAEKSITFTIETIKVSGSVAFTTSETYDGADKVAEFTLTSPDALIGGDQVTITYSGEEDRMNVTGEAITATAMLPSRNYDWVDGITPMASMTIVKATFTRVTIEFADGALDNLFTSSAMPTPTTITATPTPLPEGVKGKFAWVESSLSEGKKTYHWTYTVPNYNVFEGTQELTAQTAKLNRIEANEDYKKDYTAFDLFDVDSLVVTAYFDNGNGEESRVLSSDEYTLRSQSNIAQEGVPQLVVGDTYVTVTYGEESVQIPVTVTAKVIELPEVIEELTYNGEPQTPFDWRGAGYESYIAFFEELSSYSNCDPSIVLRTDAGDFAFTLTINDALGNNVVFENGQKTFEVASKILPKRVYLGHGDYTWGMSYNGVGVAVADLGGNTGDGNADLVFAYEDETLETKLDIVFDYVAREANDLTQLVNAGEYTLEFNLADAVVNYVADAYTTTLAITPMRVEATLTAPNEVYTGNEKNAILTVKTQLVGEDKVTVTYNNVNRIDYTGEEIVATAQLPNDNYVWADGTVTTVSFTIRKAAITSVTVNIPDAPGGVWTTAMMPEFTSVSVKPDVEGEVVWDNDSLIAGENVEQPWTFVPDSPNYEPYHGSVTLTVVQATLTGVSVEVVATPEYVAFDAFDRSSIVVQALYGEGPKEITGYTLTFSIGAEDRLLAGTGITVTVTYTDGEVTQYTVFTIDVAKRAVAKPVVDTTVFDATGETITLPIAESKYYTVEDNTAIEPGRYVATVTLKDPVNTMWEDGSTEDYMIAWTISEPVTSDEVIASILAMEKVTWQNAEEFLDLEARYKALDESEQTAEATAKLATLQAQYDTLRASALDDIEAAHEVTAKSLGKALAAAAAGLSAAAIALAIAKRRFI